MFGRIQPTDILVTTVKQATKVFCSHCRRHVFYLKNDGGEISIFNLAALQKGKPENFNCPICGQDIRAYTPEPILKTDRGYWNGKKNG